MTCWIVIGICVYVGDLWYSLCTDCIGDVSILFDLAIWVCKNHRTSNIIELTCGYITEYRYGCRCEYFDL